MRLLRVHTLTFEEFPDTSRRPPYVIASHRWLGTEITYQDVLTRTYTSSEGFKKVERFADYIIKNVKSVKHLWIDTCCINKENLPELSRSITSMFKWYHEAQQCLAYLHDVPNSEVCTNKNRDLRAFETSSWFTRGWTLQELLAPRTVVFLTKDWKVIGHKGTADTRLREDLFGPQLHYLLSQITKIPERVLIDYSHSQQLSVDERLEWMNKREITKEEDMMYALFGIFDISIEVLYGEDTALHEEIMRKLISTTM
ncbi:HET-domain-containing protein [Dissoconium aciculare CBS 342.82]|uniref:HET-domain-containing protein n=1 Tax=Dissoconium aciculare CBS 342.82 TaxID=1314786 RepID=A0A6J3M9P7_9PEZI|nr:HET-domain-containing protein [Dissoconium aciculare CBS 342.82]KAF1824760.1 HET-domain-containing protein [Dissoconium aciculare CBS 342.82]